LDNRIAPKKNITLTYVLEQAWQLVNGLKASVACVALILSAIWLVFLFIQIVLVFLLGVDNFLSYLAWKLPSLFLIWYVMAAYIMLGVRRAIGLPATFGLAWADCMRVKENLFYLSLMIVIPTLIFSALIHGASASITDLPLFAAPLILLLFIAWMYYSIIIYLFALPLIVTKRAKVSDALVSAYQSMKQYWFVSIASFIIMSLILLISMIPFGIGLIWTFPMSAALYGVLFRDVYGLSAKKQDKA
jgi:hypothetical protein